MLEICKNPNKEAYEFITQKVMANGWYCPCAFEKNDDTHCICKETWNQFEDGIEGYCHCGRYIICDPKDLDKYKEIKG